MHVATSFPASVLPESLSLAAGVALGARLGPGVYIFSPIPGIISAPKNNKQATWLDVVTIAMGIPSATGYVVSIVSS